MRVISVALNARALSDLGHRGSGRTDRAVKVDGGFDDPAARILLHLRAAAEPVASHFRCTCLCSGT
jgi:hypothetical protein